ncbi:hypothetical protein PtB15_1B875 [Puccinia triticina]|nr:hypothetical protein PtB15_1B875 [Puccinia triticina]
MMENVHLTRVHNPQTLIHTIHYCLSIFLGRHSMPKEGSPARPIKLIILDSIGVIFWADLEQLKQSSAKFRMTERAAEMNQVADGLKVLADQYRLTVVVVNQVSDVMAPPSFSSELALPRPHNTIVGHPSQPGSLGSAAILFPLFPLSPA